MNRRKLGGIALGGAMLASGMGGASTLAQGVASPSASPAVGGSLTVYSGRNEALVGPLLPQIEELTGVALEVRYGNTAELAAQILEEGENSPAGLYFGQDAGSLGALAEAGRFVELPSQVLDRVDERFRSPDGTWVGLSGRARVLVYNPEMTDPSTLPESILDLPEAELDGPIGWAPTNASFQSFVTALRVAEGEDGARAWLEAVMATDPIIFEGNSPQVEAAASGEIAVGLVNHYYLYQARKETPEIAAENYFFPGGDLGSLINVAGIGVLAGSGQEPQALAVAEALLGDEAQTYFAEETSEYPLAAGVEPVAELPPLDEFETPQIDLNALSDLEGTLALLTELGLI